MLGRLVLVLALATTALACSTTVVEEGAGGQPGAGGQDGAGGSGAAPVEDGGSTESCTHDSDCSHGRCGFLYEAECGSVTCSLPFTACPTQGWCVEPTLSACQAEGEATACACDGTTVHWATLCSAALPHGYSPVPIQSLGPCGG